MLPERQQIRDWIKKHIPLSVDATCVIDIGETDEDWDIKENECEVTNWVSLGCDLCEKTFEFPKKGLPLAELIAHAKEHLAKGEN